AGVAHGDLDEPIPWHSRDFDAPTFRRELDRIGQSLRVELTTRTSPVYVDLAAFVADQFHQVGIDVAVKELDTPQYLGPNSLRGTYSLWAPNAVGIYSGAVLSFGASMRLMVMSSLFVSPPGAGPRDPRHVSWPRAT